eukprot:54013_1
MIWKQTNHNKSTPSSQSSISPLSVSTPSTYSFPKSFQYYKNVFKTIGLTDEIQITSNLNGSLWQASYKSNKVLIKIAYNKADNNFLHESILKYLTEDASCPDSIVKYCNNFKINTDYWLIMQHNGGSSLLNFSKKAHDLIRTGQLQIAEWKKVCKIIFKQMIECIDYIHRKRVCHFNICLENFFINDVQIEINQYKNKKWKMKFIKDDIQIKLINFGASKLFTTKQCQSNNHKHFGDKHYVSPEVMNKVKRFAAKKNDIWMLGVSLFILLTQYPPWFVADKYDNNFAFVMKYSVADLLKYWNMHNYVDDSLIYIFDSIFTCQSDRISLNKIKSIFDW